MEEAVQKLTNFNAIEDLILVNQSAKQKGEVFEKHKTEYKAIFEQMQPLEKQRVETNGQISQLIGEFGHLVAQLNNDPSKA